MLKYEEFLTEMTGLIERFPSLKNRSLLSRIHSILMNISSEGAREVIVEISDGAKGVPTPNDFKEHARTWRSKFFHKNGYYYGFEPIDSQETNVKCEFCFDCGIVKVKHNVPDDFIQLMRCNCEAGLRSSAALPPYNNDARHVFVRVALNPAWFNPNISTTDDLDKMGSKLLQKHDTWRVIISKSENYWKGLGYKHDRIS